MLSEPQHQHPPVQAAHLHLRRMREQDVAQIMEIESVSFGRYHWMEDSFLSEMKNQLGRYYSLMETPPGGEPRLVGYCGYWLIFDEAHVTTVAVRPTHRGHALGELLIAHILDRGMGQSVKWVTLEVRLSNVAAQRLYYKYGFQSMGVRPKYYQDNQEDALIMTTSNIAEATYRSLFRHNVEKLRQRLGGLPEGFGQ